MLWGDLYKKKLCSPEEAVKNIKSGNRVVIGHAAAEPQILVEAMVNNHENYEAVEIVHMVPLGKCDYLNPTMEKHFRHNALFVGGGLARNAIEEGRGDYTPSFFFEIPKLFKNNILPVDVALVQVSKPDKQGYCSLGVSIDYTKSAVENAKTVIAQVNDQMPRTHGDSFVHISQIDYIVEASQPLHEIPLPVIGEIESRIGEYCASLIDDGSTLQLGIGAIPDAVLSFLKVKNDLGIHSEMFSDGILDLVENGNINNTKKTLHKGKSVANFLMGSKRLYDYVDDNPAVQMYPADYVNHPMVIAQNNKMVSINSALQIDIMGQVVAETIGYKQFSGTGGQVDFVRGASLAKEGKSIIAFPSVAAKGKISRIVPIVDEGSSITTSRNDVDYVVTEYGIASLKGKTLKERARALINIAHPDFREILHEKAKIRFRYF
ncbi:acetyl-CoA hydrolase/transferase family protein [Natronincola ferrireducens]|uniref:4-hydroxybutyrate CoA-transferase n=1 Tax=Natronincola ferrireducens TaxID=393762 RepID=A0A1G8YAV3_9FIRM|nr:acetyl-CoA hydrolase/transferase C-terminal domain-containing protein [Natronincola ferrireducens]SDJ99793.1 4-hydroxybutyrate CoA-transferase [Natronincola ferrireducens]